MLRKLIELCTGIATGSSNPLTISTALQIQGLKGEGIQDNRVWAVSSYHPIVMPHSPIF